MTDATAQLSPFVASYVELMHGSAIVLALGVPIIRLAAKKAKGHLYPSFVK